MSIGVAIGRFQIHQLHNGHIALIAHVCKRHDKVIVFLGCANYVGTSRDPLDYHAREKMIKEAFPDVVVHAIQDNQSDEVWSKEVDRLVRLTYPNAKDVFLYGGRDSFIPHYKGAFQTANIEKIVEEGYSATRTRKDLGNKVGDSAAFRHGVIYAVENYIMPFPAVRLAVDAAMTKYVVNGNLGDVIDGKGEKVYSLVMGRKANEQGWRIPGGMVDPTDEAAEHAAARELQEETGMTSEAKPEYIGTYKVFDWRGRKCPERGVMTCLFHIPYTWGGPPKAQDDLCEVKWVPLAEAEELAIIDHKPLVARLKEFLEKKG